MVKPQVYLLTGKPGTGKTSLVKQVVAEFTGGAGGFYTEEIREQGTRLGFILVTLDGQEAILSHVNIRSPYRVSKYGVDTEKLDKVGVTALRRAIQKCDIVVIDEIGKMELFSLAFREAVLEALNSGKKVAGTIMLAPHTWADRIKKDPRVKVREVSRTNRQHILEELTVWLENK